MTHEVLQQACRVQDYISNIKSWLEANEEGNRSILTDAYLVDIDIQAEVRGLATRRMKDRLKTLERQLAAM